MLKYIGKQIRRSVVTNALFCLLLTLAGTLLCISAGLWYSAHKALLDIDETITTIAIPDRVAINRFAIQLVDSQNPDIDLNLEEDMIFYVDSIRETELDIFRRIREEVYTSRLLQMDQRRIFNAFAEGIEPLTLRIMGVGVEPFIAEHSGQALAAFVVTCELLTSEYTTRHDWDWIDGEVITLVTIEKVHEARFLVNEVLQLHPVNIAPHYISIKFVLNHDGSAPFETGKQYVVSGRFERNWGIDGLVLETPDVETVSTVLDLLHSNDEYREFVNAPSWQSFFFDAMSFPIEIVEYSYVRQLEENDGWQSFLEVEGSLEETMASDRWLPMKESMEGNRIAADSFQVITTNDPNSLPRFNQNRNLFDEGRTFTPREIREGMRVCIVSREFADHNELIVGDTLPLQLYNTVLGLMEVSYMISDGIMGTGLFWIPSVYQRDLEISVPEEFTVVGIYNTIRTDRNEYAIPPNTVIIPNSSFGELTGEPASIFDTSGRAPILLNSLIVPNGRINETKDVISSIVPGYGGLFRFFDQGYDSLITTLGNLRFGMTWILTLTAAGWLVVLFIFLMFYVARKRKEGALLYALGVSRAKRFIWIFTQCATLILVALGISIAVSLPLYGDILDIAAGVAQEFTDSFRNLTLSEAADSGLRNRIPLDRSPLALIITVAGASLITLITAGFLTKRSVAFRSMAEKGGDE